MGKRGPKKKPSIIEALEGFPCKEALRDTHIAGLGEPFVAEHLMDDARGCIEVVRDSMPVGIYSRLDSYLLAAFGMAWAMHKMAAHKINDPGFEAVYKANDQGLLVQSPWLSILNKQAMMMASLGDRLGLNPAGRAALKLPSEKQQDSKFAGLIAQTRLSNLSSVLPFRQGSAKAARSA